MVKEGQHGSNAERVSPAGWQPSIGLFKNYTKFLRLRLNGRCTASKEEIFCEKETILGSTSRGDVSRSQAPKAKRGKGMRSQVTGRLQPFLAVSCQDASGRLPKPNGARSCRREKKCGGRNFFGGVCAVGGWPLVSRAQIGLAARIFMPITADSGAAMGSGGTQRASTINTHKTADMSPATCRVQVSNAPLAAGRWRYVEH